MKKQSQRPEKGRIDTKLFMTVPKQLRRRSHRESGEAARRKAPSLQEKDRRIPGRSANQCVRERTTFEIACEEPSDIFPQIDSVQWTFRDRFEA
jgi:hypothetical protein